jgi:trimethylamine--corrinoid protein Co-methyltransferase
MSERARTALENALKLENGYDFEGAKKIYGDLLENAVEEQILEKARWRMEDMDDLIAEKAI